MKEIIKSWLGIEVLESQVVYLMHPLPSGKSILEARVEELEEYVAILGALLDYLDVYPTKEWIPDVSRRQPEMPMRQVFKIRPQRVNKP